MSLSDTAGKIDDYSDDSAPTKQFNGVDLVIAVTFAATLLFLAYQVGSAIKMSTKASNPEITDSDAEDDSEEGPSGQDSDEVDRLPRRRQVTSDDRWGRQTASEWQVTRRTDFNSDDGGSETSAENYADDDDDDDDDDELGDYADHRNGDDAAPAENHFDR